MLTSEILSTRFEQLGLDLPQYQLVEIHLKEDTKYECICDIPDLNITEFVLDQHPDKAKELVSIKVLEKLQSLSLLPTYH
ncbi:hypothetical protein OAO18_00820 [Francisellaceae bacterium]|jgi:hypothetical protein|nr:hypothetical protein [Francisellaceae bacterium]